MFAPAGISSQNAPSRFSLFSPQSQNAKTDQLDEQKVNSPEISHFKKALAVEGNTNELKRSSYAQHSSVSFPAPKIQILNSLDPYGSNRSSTLNVINPPQIDLQTEPSSTKSGQTNRSFWGNANTPIGHQPGSPTFEDVGGEEETHSPGNRQLDLEENSWNNTNNNIKQPKQIKRNLFQRVNKNEKAQENSSNSQVLLQKKAKKYNKIKKMFGNPSQPPITLPTHLKEGLRKCSSLDHFYTYQQPTETLQNSFAIQPQMNQKMGNLQNPKLKIKSIINGMNNKTANNAYPSTPHSNKSSIHSSAGSVQTSNSNQKLQRRDSMNLKTEDKKGKMFLSLKSKESKESINKNINQQQQQSRGDRVKNGLRRKSCCCGECGALTRFEIKHQNIISMIQMRHKRARLTRIFKIVNFLNKMVSKDHSQIATSTLIPQTSNKQSSTTLKNISSSREIKLISKDVQQSLSLENIQTQLTIEADQKEQIPQGKLSLQSKSSKKINSVENGIPIGIITHSSNIINDNNNGNFSNSNSTINSSKKVEDVVQTEKKKQFRREKSMTFSGGINLSQSNANKRSQIQDARENSRKGRNYRGVDENEKYNENDEKSKNNSFELLDNKQKQLNLEDEQYKQPWKPKTMVFDDEVLGENETTKKRRTSFMFLVESKMKEAKRRKQADEMKFIGKTPLAVLFKLLSQGKKDSVFAQQPTHTKLAQFINSTSFNNNSTKHNNIENSKINTNSFDNETPDFTNQSINPERNTVSHRCHSFYRNASSNNNNTNTKQENKIQLQSLLQQREKNFDLRESNSIRPVSMGSNPSTLRRLVISPSSNCNLIQNQQSYKSGLKVSKSTLTLLSKTSLNKSSSRKNQKYLGESSQQSWRGPSQVSQRSTKTFLTTSPPTLMNASPPLANSPTPSTILNNIKSSTSGSGGVSLIQLAKVPQQKVQDSEKPEKDGKTQSHKYLNRSSTQKIGLNSTSGNKVFLQGGFLTTREPSRSIENSHSKIQNQSLHNQQQQQQMLDQVDQRKPLQQQQQGFQRFTPYLQQIFQPSISRSVEKNDRLALSCQSPAFQQQQSSKGFISLKPSISARSPFKLGQLPACKATYSNLD